MITTSMTDEEYLNYLTPETKAECELVKRLEATVGTPERVRGLLEDYADIVAVKGGLEDELKEALIDVRNLTQEVTELRTIIAKLEAGGACDA